MMPRPTAITSSGSVIRTPVGDASARPILIAGGRSSVVYALRLLLATRLVDALRRELERGQKPALATRRVETDARWSGPQVGRILGRMRRQLVRQRARRRVTEHDELAAVVLEEVAIAQPEQRALGLD